MKVKIIFLVLLFLGLFSWTGSSRAADWYVSPTGAAAWAACGAPAKSGAAACSWQTAMANAVEGDTVYFRGGIYEPGESNQFDDPKIHPANNGSEGNPIILMAYPGETPIIHDSLRTGVVAPANNTGTAAGCYQNSYVTWDGFTFDRDKDNGYQASAIFWIEMSDHCVLKNSELIAHGQNDQYNGALIHILHSYDTYIYNNKIHGKYCNVEPSSACVNATSIWYFGTARTNIYNNDIYDNNNCLSYKTNPSYLNVYNNHFWNCPRAVINAGPSTPGNTDFNIYQNVMRNSGTAFYSPDAPALNYNTKFYNNSIYNSSPSDLAQINNGNYTNTRGSEIFNNIISVGGAGSVFERFGDGVDKPTYADYNDFYGTGDWRVAYAAIYNTLADWRMAMNLDLNSITSNPQFINAGGSNPEDYKLQPGSPARIGRGGSYASVMGAYITGNEIIGYEEPAQSDTTPPAAPTGLTIT